MPRRQRWRVAAIVPALAALSVACGSDGALSPAGDGGPGRDGGGGLERYVPMAPEPPALPAAPEAPRPAASPMPPAGLSPGSCPDGWSEVALGEGHLCEPWSRSDAPACAAGTLRAPGMAACQAIDECPTGPFPETVPDARPVMYVQAGAAGGDGSRAAPFGTLAEAVAAAPTGAYVAVAKGVYEEPLVVDDAITVEGACAAETQLRPQSPGPVVQATGSDIAIRHLRLGPAQGNGLSVFGAGTTLTLGSVIVADVVGAGVTLTDGATLQAERVLVDTVAPTASGARGRLLELGSGAAALVAEAVLRGAHEVGVLVAGASSELVLEDVRIADVEGRSSDGALGRGVLVQGGGRAELRRCVVERTREIGLSVSGSGSSATAERCVIRSTRGRASDAGLGIGVNVRGGATGGLRGTLVESNRSVGVGVAFEGSSVELTDVAIRDTEMDELVAEGGWGLWGGPQSVIEASRLWVSNNRSNGIRMENGARATIEDAEVRGTRAGPRQAGGIAAEGATLTLRRARVEDNVGRSVDASLNGVVELVDGQVRGTRSLADGAAGEAIVARSGASIELRRLELAEHAGTSLGVAGARSRLRAEDLTLRGGTSASPESFGVLAADQASLVLERFVALGAPSGVVIVGGEGTTATLRDVTIRDPAPSANGSAFGIQIVPGALVEGNRVLVEGSTGGAITLRNAELNLADVTIRDTASFSVGNEAAAAVGAWDSSRLRLERVAVEDSRDNGVWIGELEGRPALGPPTSAEIVDLTVRGTRARPEIITGGQAVTAFDGTLRLERALLEDNASEGLAVVGPRASATVTDMTIREVLEGVAQGASGLGIAVLDEGGASIDRLTVDRARSAAILLAFSSTLELRDAALQDTLSEEGGLLGRGVAVQFGSQLQASRLSMRQSRDVGLSLFDSTAEVEELSIVGVAATECREEGCENLASGHGLGVYEGSELSVTGFQVDDATLCGVHLTSGSEADLRTGSIANARIGACVAAEGFDLDRLTQDVVFLRNERNLDSPTLPVPDPVSAPSVGMP